MSRWKAAGIHFGISLVIATTLVLVMLMVLYPPPYFKLMGGDELIFLIAGCDVVLGPLITLIIFKSGKWGLKFDLACIGTVQVLSLAYGLHTMLFIARPVYTLFVVDRFEVVSAHDISDDELAKAKAANTPFASLPWTGPKLAAGLLPSDPNEGVSLAGHGDVKGAPRLYVPYDIVVGEVGRRARPIKDLQERIARSEPGAAAELARYAATPDKFGYLPVVGLFNSMTAVVDKRSGRIETIVDCDPW